MRRMILRGDRTHPFELFTWDDEKPGDEITIPLTPKQVRHLIAIAAQGYNSWADAQAENIRPTV